jgi:photosystem II stability/assembly factor-like uncharacterized protein
MPTAPPPDAIPKALQQQQASRAELPPNARVAGMFSGPRVNLAALMPPQQPGAAPPPPGVWTSIGPDGVGGRIRSILFKPGDDATMFIGSAGGGVWETHNAGDSWMASDETMTNLAVSCMVIDPTNPEHIYAGTGEGFKFDAIRGAGLFERKQVDGTPGLYRFAAVKATREGALREPFQSINRLAISSDGKVLLVATPSGLFRSAAVTRDDWAAARDIAGGMADVKFHPTDPARAIAGSLDTGRAYWTDDGGKTWKESTHADPWAGRVELAYASKKGSRVVYASMNNGVSEIWRSQEGGRTFERRKTLDKAGDWVNYLGTQGWYDNAIWAGRPDDDAFVIVGGIDLWKSEDGGDTLTKISNWQASPSSAHADHHVIVAHPKFGTKGDENEKSIFFGNDGGLYWTREITTVGTNPEQELDKAQTLGWEKRNGNLGITQFYHADGLVIGASNLIVGGAQDNGTLTSSGASASWTPVSGGGGDGGPCAVDRSDPKFLYGEYIYGRVFRSSDGGSSAEFIDGEFWDPTQSQVIWKPSPFSIPDAQSERGLFEGPLALDQKDPNRLLVGGMSVWQTRNAREPNNLVNPASGPSWKMIKSSTGAAVSAMAIAHDDSDLVWVGHTTGDLYVSTNATHLDPLPTWKKIDDNGEPDQRLPNRRICTSITPDPTDREHGRLYVTFSGFYADNLWATTDGGKTWGPRGKFQPGRKTLPEAPVYAVAIHPSNRDYLYAATDVGVFGSSDQGKTWGPLNGGPTNCQVRLVFFVGKSLIAATHGRGLFLNNLAHIRPAEAVAAAAPGTASPPTDPAAR